MLVVRRILEVTFRRKEQEYFDMNIESADAQLRKFSFPDSSPRPGFGEI